MTSTVGKPILSEHVRKCDICNEGIARDIPIFYRLHIERMGVDARAARSIVGLTMILGSERLAAAMATDDQVAKPIGDPDELVVCQRCGNDRETSVALLADIAATRTEKRG